ncbi:MAG TPA: M23 family metallopeptidase, partial [Nocardioidaceae bacterium]|nr:M23 family metallopeptidase [Nocardioidaceae bacterium]
QTTYGHLASVNVGNGEHVNAGEVVGRIGSRGYSTGPHLHFEVRVDQVQVSPGAWLRERGIEP